ncbi:hypothetical protein HS088_TW22G01541 [Tripterygium wilfordii]|uniref:Uncharacterized protein n=1 Tax=Tripterygium wilfordii TaxID=458696 RepID=A0A7J7C135_TRIWF|nr:uncharacterized protein LOC119991931 isoform X2 [Tripterygium wilfordii]XP_038694411.1 uncharacterized protein LOC119991931 isoform X2 [Tripterygium wilfordii]XP_038694412.1 uncharacterized protein LOC119991931 isoform X2 [Tripterygium wilfordii]XP_038694413.1 uncharacterized protein LOC119991931 isoform X2 [Tripterygium wilfordii]KAF5727844.1 hypothetical protein HS088_TW22G01541 [Tripterygium wilfordii]
MARSFLLPLVLEIPLSTGTKIRNTLDKRRIHRVIMPLLWLIKVLVELVDFVEHSINSAILWTKQYVNGGASPIWRLNHFDKNLDVQQVSGNGSIVCMSNVTNALSEYWTIVPHQ